MRLTSQGVPEIAAPMAIQIFVYLVVRVEIDGEAGRIQNRRVRPRARVEWVAVDSSGNRLFDY